MEAQNASNVMTCKQCNKRVYEMEKIIADSSIYHKTCFKCSHCKRVLSLGNYTAGGTGGNKQLYCKPHFIELFRTKGNYEEGFGMEKKTRPPGCDTFEGLQPNAGSTPQAAKQKSPSKWEKSAGQPEVANRRDDLDGGPSDLPSTSTREMLARYTTAAGGDGQGSVPKSHEPVTTAELPEQGTTKALLAKFKEIQNGGGAKSPAAVKQPIKLVDDEDTGRSSLPTKDPISPRSPQPARITPEGSVSPAFEHHQHEPAPISSPQANGASVALHSGSSRSGSEARYSQYDNEEEAEDLPAGNGDAGLLVAIKREESSKVEHDISDEDDVERDIESHRHHYEGHEELGHHHQGHEDVGHGQYESHQDVGHEEVGHGHYESHEEVGHGHEDERHGHYQGNEEVGHDDYEREQAYGRQHHEEEEDQNQGYPRHEEHHRAEEGQLINFDDEEGRQEYQGRNSNPTSPVHQHHEASNASDDDDDRLGNRKASREEEEEE